MDKYYKIITKKVLKIIVNKDMLKIMVHNKNNLMN